MTEAQRREAARRFSQKWQGKGKEDEDARSYWIEILSNILGMENVTDRVDFEKKVIVDGHTKRIDVYIPETGVLIEQKSLGIDLNKPGTQSGGIELTPYEQAKRYNDNLPVSERARWIVTSNFAFIHVYDMDTKIPEDSLQVIDIQNLQTESYRLDFLVKKESVNVSKEVEVSKDAGRLVGKIYDAFLKQYKEPDNPDTLHSLNALCVRLVFCLYAEDAGVFGKRNMFREYLKRFDTRDMRRALIDLFECMDTPADKRDPYMDEDLSAFPYVNGGLFSDTSIEIPLFSEEIRALLINEACDFDWSLISPTIFGAVFESTLNPETRRAGGMHYTSTENIHKVIDPLFLDDLKAELDDIKNENVLKKHKERLDAFQEKLAGLTFLDPACGSGNFLTETYLWLRRLENEVLKMKIVADKKEVDGQIVFGIGGESPIKVSIGQFYGIEINDFAVSVAQTALWIAESQMLKETEDVVHQKIEFLPLKSFTNIVEGNALRLDWADVIEPNKLDYIMGNPPFAGARWMGESQKKDVFDIFGKDWKNVGDLDYVTCWYKKSVDYMQNTNIKVALVSTNSITQGGAVSNIWKPLFSKGMDIIFAYRSFIWDSEANEKAHVHVVIIGFTCMRYDNNSSDIKSKETAADNNKRRKTIFVTEYERQSNNRDKKKEVVTATSVSNINGYLLEAENIFIEKRTKPISDVPEICLGGQAIDDGNLILTQNERDDLIKKEPESVVLLRPYMMGKDFINREFRYCLWLVGVEPSVLRKCPEVLDRIERVKKFRLSSNRSNTLKAAETPQLFATVLECSDSYIAFPKVSSENRRYIPIDYLDKSIIPGDKLFVFQNATMYEFGIMTSNVHMAWMRAVCGRLKSDYSYSNTIVYNNFPWPTPTEAQKAAIEKTAQGILDARNIYPDSSLADLYDPLTMPPELQKAHTENDRAVMKAYGFDIKNMSEADCVAELMRMYQEMTGGEKKYF